MQTKIVKQLLELYQLGRDKKRKSTKIIFFNIESEKMWYYRSFTPFRMSLWKFSKSQHFMIMLTKTEPEKYSSALFIYCI